MNGILANHAADIVMFDVPPLLQSRGIEAYQKTWDVFFAWSDDPAVFDFTDMQITAGTDVAFVAALMRCSGTEKDGKKIKLAVSVNDRPAEGW
jgi:ketosteroid isomerase-like protein